MNCTISLSMYVRIRICMCMSTLQICTAMMSLQKTLRTGLATASVYVFKDNVHYIQPHLHTTTACLPVYNTYAYYSDSLHCYGLTPVQLYTFDNCV